MKLKAYLKKSKFGKSSFYLFMLKQVVWIWTIYNQTKMKQNKTDRQQQILLLISFAFRLHFATVKGSCIRHKYCFETSS